MKISRIANFVSHTKKLVSVEEAEPIKTIIASSVQMQYN
jgi:hypothetical protein